MTGVLQDDDTGATIVEFALIAPVALMLLLGMFDLGYNLYTASVLQGSIQKTARDSTIEGARAAQLDASVERAVRNLSPSADIAFTRTSYANFADVRTPEDFSDLNGDNLCNDGEPFEDVNGNGTWDADRGSAGGGGARDAVLYSVTVSYPRVFPVAGLLGLPEDHSLTVETVLRNQPWNTQTGSSATGNCA